MGATVLLNDFILNMATFPMGVASPIITNQFNLGQAALSMMISYFGFASSCSILLDYSKTASISPILPSVYPFFATVIIL